jgi:hypothetical protein
VRDAALAAASEPSMMTGTFILALLGAASGAVRPPDTPSWDRLQCFAYSPAAHAYACFDFDLGSDVVGPNGIRPMDFERWVPPAHTAWSGHKAVHLVGSELDTALSIAEHPYGRGRAIVRGRNAREAIRSATARGFSVRALRAIPLGERPLDENSGRIGALHDALSPRRRERVRDRSLQLDCGNEANARVIELLTHLRGASAVAFAAPRATSFVVGVMEEGGGEGSGYFGTWYLHVDPRRVCGSP